MLIQLQCADRIQKAKQRCLSAANQIRRWGWHSSSPITPACQRSAVTGPFRRLPVDTFGHHVRHRAPAARISSPPFFLRVPHGGRKDLRIEAACLPSLSVTDQIRCAFWLWVGLNGRVEYSQHDGTIVCFRGFVTLCESTHLWCQWEKKKVSTTQFY